jgi:hypothetical protein
MNVANASSENAPNARTTMICNTNCLGESLLNFIMERILMKQMDLKG